MAKKTEPPEENTWNETRPMNSQDQRLRRAGFKIKRRPKTGPDIWERNGKEYTTREAVAQYEAELNAIATQK